MIEIYYDLMLRSAAKQRVSKHGLRFEAILRDAAFGRSSEPGRKSIE
jgi:hypothetical protein